MVASDQNQVFDTGDPSGVLPEGPQQGGLIEPPAPPTLKPVPLAPPAQDDLVKMQDLLLSQKRDEIFGKNKKKRKNKEKKMKIREDNKETATQQPNLPQDIANHSAPQNSVSLASEEPRPPRKKVKKAKNGQNSPLGQNSPNGQNGQPVAKTIEESKPRPPKRLFKSRSWDEDQPLASLKKRPNLALGNIKTQQCLQCPEHDAHLIKHLLLHHGIRGKVCPKCQLIFRKLKNHLCQSGENGGKSGANGVNSGASTSDAAASSSSESVENGSTVDEKVEKNGKSKDMFDDPYAFPDEDFDNNGIEFRPPSSSLQTVKTYSRKFSESAFNSSKLEDVEIDKSSAESITAFLEHDQDKDSLKEEHEVEAKHGDEVNKTTSDEIDISPTKVSTEDPKSTPSKKSSKGSKRKPKVIEPVGDILAKSCLKCSQCGFKKRLHMLKHLRQEHELKVKPCNECNFVFRFCHFKRHVCERRTLSKLDATKDDKGKDSKTDLPDQNGTIVQDTHEAESESKQNDEDQDAKIDEDIQSTLTTPEKRKRRAPSRLISEEDENDQQSVKKSPKKITTPKKSETILDEQEQPCTSTMDNLMKTPPPPTLTPANEKSAAKAAKSAAHGRFYKPEHRQLLVDLYEKSNKYPSKAEMAEVAKAIGILPIKVLWWFTHRRRQEKKVESRMTPTGTLTKTTPTCTPIKTTPIKEDVESTPAKTSLDDSEGSPTKTSPGGTKRKPRVIEPVGDVLAKTCLKCSQGGFAKRLHLITHLRQEHELKVKSCTECNFIFRFCHFKRHDCAPRTKIEEKVANAVLPVTPNKSIISPKVSPAKMQTKPTFFSKRYHNLLQEFSPKKNQSSNQDLGEMLTKTSFHRNGKLELNYVTPTQLKAVEEFLYGDVTEKVNFFR